jgi:hypothetical protein
VVSEFYTGDFYSLPPAEQVERFAWYDRLVRQDWYVLAMLPFTVDPSDGWRHQDYTPAYRVALDYLAAERDKPNAVRGPVPPPEPANPVADSSPPTAGTHVVTAVRLSVRAHPWTGRLEPPRLRLLNQGDVVRVLGVYQPAGLPFGWGCIADDGNAWVSMEFVRPV